MITEPHLSNVRKDVQSFLERASISITSDEAKRIEVADFGLNDLEHIGLQLLTYINTERVCAKELVLFPLQACPEHYHPSIQGELGKEETFRCRWGEVYLYVPGEPSRSPKSTVPDEHRKHLTVWHEIHLRTGEQHTIWPETLHWFQAGAEGAVVSEFSTRSRDEFDIFTDPKIVR